MHQRILLSTFLLIVLSATLTAQKCDRAVFDDFITKGQVLVEQGDYIKAFEYYNSAKDFCPEEGGEVAALTEALIQKIAEDKRITEEALVRANTARAAAAASQNASLALRIAEKDPTLGLRIADYNRRVHSYNTDAIIAYSEIMSDTIARFYKNFVGHVGHVGHIYSVAFAPDGLSILTASQDSTVKIWSQDGQELLTLRGHKGPIISTAFSPDGRFILTGSQDNTAKLWDVRGQELLSLQGHMSYVSSVAFSPDGNFLLTGSSDNTAKVWDLQGRVQLTLVGHKESIYSVTFSPDGLFILTGSRDNTAKLWDLAGQ